MLRKDVSCIRLPENAHLLCCTPPSSLRRTTEYASFLKRSRALYLNIFQQSHETRFFRYVPGLVRVLISILVVCSLFAYPAQAHQTDPVDQRSNVHALPVSALRQVSGSPMRILSEWTATGFNTTGWLRNRIDLENTFINASLLGALQISGNLLGTNPLKNCLTLIEGRSLPVYENNRFNAYINGMEILQAIDSSTASGGKPVIPLFSFEGTFQPMNPKIRFFVVSVVGK